MRIFSQLGARVALHGLLVLALILSGGAPSQVCSSEPATAGCACSTLETVAGSELDSEGARAVDPTPVAHSANTERKSIAPVVPAARVSYPSATLVKGCARDRAKTAAPSPLYVRHCAFLC